MKIGRITRISEIQKTRNIRRDDHELNPSQLNPEAETQNDLNNEQTAQAEQWSVSDLPQDILGSLPIESLEKYNEEDSQQ